MPSRMHASPPCTASMRSQLPDATAAVPDATAAVPDAPTAVPDATAAVPDATAAVPDATAPVPDAPDAANVLHAPTGMPAALPVPAGAAILRLQPSRRRVHPTALSPAHHTR